MIQQIYSFSGPQLAFILALPLAEWVTTCIAIDEDYALSEAARPSTATEAVADPFEQALGAATTETFSSSTTEAVVRGRAEGRRQLLAWPKLNIYTYKEGVAMEGPIVTHVVPAFVLATLFSVWQESESLGYLVWKCMITFICINSIGKALSWFIGGSRETVARNAAGHPVHGTVVLQPGIHLLAYGASGLLTMALFLHSGSFFLLLPMLFLAFTGASGYRRLYAVDHSLMGILLGSCTLVSLLTLGVPLLVWIIRPDALPKSEKNDDGNDISDRLSKFDEYSQIINTDVMIIFIHAVLISAFARLDIALARFKAARRPVFAGLVPLTSSYNTLPPLKETPFGGGPTGPRLVVPGVTPSSLRLGLYTVVGLLSTTLLVVAAPEPEWIFFISPNRSDASLAESQYVAALISPLVFTPLIYLAARSRGELRTV